MPGPTIDWTIEDGISEIPIEQRDTEEVTAITGRGPDGQVIPVQITPNGAKAANYAFDVTPARLITGLITSEGVSGASKDSLAKMYPESCDIYISRTSQIWRYLAYLIFINKP